MDAWKQVSPCVLLKLFHGDSGFKVFTLSKLIHRFWLGSFKAPVWCTKYLWTKQLDMTTKHGKLPRCLNRAVAMKQGCMTGSWQNTISWIHRNCFDYACCSGVLTLVIKSEHINDKSYRYRDQIFSRERSRIHIAIIGSFMKTAYMYQWYFIPLHDDVIKWKHFRVTGPLCGNSPVTGEFLSQRPVTWSFDIFFDLRLNKRLSKQSWGWWFETPSCSIWRHCNGTTWSHPISDGKWLESHDKLTGVKWTHL